MIHKFKILDVVGCCDIIQEKAEATAQKYNIKAFSLQEILSDPSIELVVNLTIPPVHYPCLEGAPFLVDPNHFGGDVKVILKGNEQSFVVQQNHAFNEESRGLGAAEMAWSMRRGRKERANKEMAYHALEVLHGIGISSETKSTYFLKSTFEKMPPLPRGYLGQSCHGSSDESGIAL